MYWGKEFLGNVECDKKRKIKSLKLINFFIRFIMVMFWTIKKTV